MAPWREAEVRGLETSPSENFFGNALFCPKKAPFLIAEIGP